jgi:hypothetical protein
MVEDGDLIGEPPETLLACLKGGRSSGRARHPHLRIADLEKALEEIRAIMLRPAGNRRFMQIAGPARQALNIIKAVLQ